MNNDMIWNEDLGEWIDPEAQREEAEEIERAARYEAADRDAATRAETMPEEGDYL